MQKQGSGWLEDDTELLSMAVICWIGKRHVLFRGESAMKFHIPSLSCVEFLRNLKRLSACTNSRNALLMLLTSNYPFSTYKRERTIFSSRFFLMFAAFFGPDKRRTKIMRRRESKDEIKRLKSLTRI